MGGRMAGMDFGLNGVQAPLRALITDLCPNTQQQRLQVRLGFATTLAQAMVGPRPGAASGGQGYLLGAVHISDGLTFFREWGGDVADYDAQALYICGSVIFVSVIGAACGLLAEQQLSPELAARVPASSDGLISQNLHAISNCPVAISRAWVIQFFHFFAFFTVFTFGTDYFGKYIYHGDATAEDGSQARHDYNDGVRAGNFALACQCLLACLTTLSLPLLISRIGIHFVLYFCNISLATCLILLGCLSDPSRAAATVIVTLMGFGWAATVVLPWYIVSRACVSLRSRGVYNSLFNSAQCFPEIAISLIGLVIFAAGGSVRALFIVGAVGAIAAVCFNHMVIVPEEIEDSADSQAPASGEAASELAQPLAKDHDQLDEHTPLKQGQDQAVLAYDTSTVLD